MDKDELSKKILAPQPVSPFPEEQQDTRSPDGFARFEAEARQFHPSPDVNSLSFVSETG
jgi:hypothetical protein